MPEKREKLHHHLLSEFLYLAPPQKPLEKRRDRKMRTIITDREIIVKALKRDKYVEIMKLNPDWKEGKAVYCFKNGKTKKPFAKVKIKYLRKMMADLNDPPLFLYKVSLIELVR